RISIVSKDVLDIHPRKVCYFPATGKAMVKRLAHSHPETLETQERAGNAAVVVKSTAGGSIDLQLYSDSTATLQCVRADGSQHDAAAIADDLWGDADRNQSLVSQFDKLYYHQPVGARLFIDDILAGRKSSPSLYDGWQAQRVIDAAFESQRRGGWVEV
ncbi:MAG TPA: hypothetical protein PKA05_16180, partial [Roseiflexaceae bacterium]|nr:hypothetical protein [Roseiflexaceae bacterium]